MALILKDRVRETSSSTGTGNITLGGAISGYQTFNAAIASGSTVYYTIHNLTAGVDNEWEVGLGTFTSPATLARTTVLSSSNSGSAVNFTAGASGLEVFITQPAEEAVYLNQATGLVEIGGNGTNTVSFTNVNTTNLTATTSNATTFNGTTGNFSNVVGATLTSAKLGNNLDTNGYNVIGGNFGGNQLVLPAGFGPTLQGLYEGNAFIKTGNAGSVTRTWTFLDSDGSFTSPGPVVASSFSGSGSTINAINASNISSGTIDNARTTAASANGASTIVLRDSSGSFDANLVNAVSLSGNAATVTGINASNISSGTVATARLGSGTANSSTFLRGDQTYAVVSSGITLTDDTTTNATYYPTLTTATSGTISAANVSSTKLFFNPSTGTLTATVMSANSDERLKENWTDVAPDFVSKLAQVKHGVFSRTDSGNREPGVGAQSFMTVLPEAVVEGADGYLSVNYGGAALVAAIELAKVVEELRAEIAELKAK